MGRLSSENGRKYEFFKNLTGKRRARKMLKWILINWRQREKTDTVGS